MLVEAFSFLYFVFHRFMRWSCSSNSRILDLRISISPAALLMVRVSLAMEECA